MNLRIRHLLVLAVFLPLSIGQAQTLSVGDPAPPIQIESWLKGSGPLKWGDGKIYLIDFWATWCGPCLASMPHLAELQKKYGEKGLRVITVTAFDKYGNDLASVKSFLKENDKKMPFAVAWDKRQIKGWQGFVHGQTFVDYMSAGNIEGIPCVFLVDQSGHIAYIGLSGGVGDVIDSVLTGNFDLTAAARQYRAIQALKPDLVRYSNLLKEANYDKAYELGWQIVRGAGYDDPRTLAYYIAAPIVNRDRKTQQKDLQLALFASNRAVELTRSTDPGMMSVLAESYFADKKYSQAISVIKSTIALLSRGAKSSDEGLRKIYEKLLKEYESAMRKDKSTTTDDSAWHPRRVVERY